MKVNNLESNLPFGQVSLSSRTLINISKEQINMYLYAKNILKTSPNKIHFDVDNNHNLIIAVLNTSNEIIQKFFCSSKETLNKAINYCINLPKPNDYGKHPVSFEKFLDEYCFKRFD